jgi:predicted ATP-binding protein involved in virulence
MFNNKDMMKVIQEFNMIASLSIEGLFGKFDYDITLKKDGVTILSGPNGYGKSTILRILEAISKGNFLSIARIDFSKIDCVFENNTKTSFIKNGKTMQWDEIKDINIDSIRNYSSHYISKRPYLPFVRANENWIDGRTENFISDSQNIFIEKYDDEILYCAIEKSDRILKKQQEFVKKHCGDIRYISDQRLIRIERSQTQEEPRIKEVIKELPGDLVNEINRVLAEYSSVSNKLDSTYPNRLFKTKDGIKEDDYKIKLDEANKKFEKLKEYKLVEMSLIQDYTYKEEFKAALKIYFSDFGEKYQVLEALISKLDLFSNILNNRLLFKKIEISKDKGFEIVDKDNSQRKLELDQLSSGEKQEIVLFYELIFKSKKGLMLLIDEPEISLHITWQQNFMDDLLKVAKINNMQVIVATHSPQIIGNHRDLQIDLGEIYGEKFNSQ